MLGGVAAVVGAVGLSSCEVATRFRGPGFERGRGVVLDDVGGTVVVVVTNARLDRAKRGVFMDYSQRVVEDLPNHDGFIGHSLRRRLLGGEVWTVTVWRDDAAADEFVAAPQHKEAVRQGMSAIVQARFHRFSWPTDRVPPTWDVVKKELDGAAFIDYAGGKRPGGP